MELLKKIFGHGSRFVSLEGNLSKEILEELGKTKDEQIAEQLRQLQQSIYHLSGRIKEQTEYLIQLTTAIEILQHETEEKKEEEPVKLTPRWTSTAKNPSNKTLH